MLLEEPIANQPVGHGNLVPKTWVCVLYMGHCATEKTVKHLSRSQAVTYTLWAIKMCHFVLDHNSRVS